MGEQLIMVQVNRATAHMAPVNRQIYPPAKILVDFQGNFLMHTNADIGCVRAAQTKQGIVVFRHIEGEAMEYGLAANARNQAKI